MENGEAKFSLGEILCEALVVGVLLETEVGVVITDLEIKAEQRGQRHVRVLGGVARGRGGEQLHQPDRQVEEATWKRKRKKNLLSFYLNF